MFGIEGPWWLVKPDLALGSVIFVHVWKYLPFWTLILLAGRMAISTDLYEAARIDGASPLQQFWYVTWPQLKNLYITSLLLSTIWSLGDFNSVYLLTGGGPGYSTYTIVYYLYQKTFVSYRLGYGAAMGYLIFVMIFIFSVLQFRYGNREARP